MREKDVAGVRQFQDACGQFIRGSWTAQRGATTERTLKSGEKKTDKVFDILIHAGQVNGAPEKDAVVLVQKSKGEVALFILTECVHQDVNKDGIAYSLWRGTPVQRPA